MSLQLIGLTRADGSQRCNGCIDFSDNDYDVVYEGSELNCLYCGDAWAAKLIETAPEAVETPALCIAEGEVTVLVIGEDGDVVESYDYAAYTARSNARRDRIRAKRKAYGTLNELLAL